MERLSLDILEYADYYNIDQNQIFGGDAGHLFCI